MSAFKVQKRDASGTRPAHLRKSGIVPMALVERTHVVLPLQATIVDLRAAMKQADGLGRLDIAIEGEAKPRKAVVKKVDLDPLKHQLLHVTLQEISSEDLVKLNVPVVALGEPSAVGDGGVQFTQSTDHLVLRGKMANMPEKIEVDVSGLRIGEHVNAGDVQLPEGIELLSSSDATLFSLKHAGPVNLEPETAEAEATEETTTEETEA